MSHITNHLGKGRTSRYQSHWQ